MGKKILYINQYFKHPSEPGITRSYWIARQLVEAGYEVTMLAHKNTLLNHVGGEVPLKEITEMDGIRVIYLRNQYSNEMGIAGRAWAFLSFMFRAVIAALREKNVDLIVATSTPLTVAVPALMCKWLKRIPYIFEVRDLWPEVPIQMGAIKEGVIAKSLRWLEKTTYVNAEHVVALSPGMQDGVTQYVDKARTSMIPNMAKVDQFWPRAKNVELMKKMGLRESSFKVVYFGQMGISNALDYVYDATQLISKEGRDVEFLFLGHGKMKKVLSERAIEDGDSNIHIYERIPMAEMSEVVNFCDVSLVTFTNLPILYTNSPNKLFDSLSAGKPIVVNSLGWTKDMVDTHDCGVFVDPADAQDLADKLLMLESDPNVVERLGGNARTLAETVYDKSILCRQFVDVVDEVMRNIEKRNV